MRADLLHLLACPRCGGDLARDSTDRLVCRSSHRYPIVEGVPRLLASWTPDASSISATFGRQWRLFRYDEDRTWGVDAQARLEIFLRDIGEPGAWFRGKNVLDAGCGNAVLASAIETLGCHVIAADVSSSVVAARRRFGDRVFFVQMDLMRPALKPQAFDVIYCGGVLHHAPDTRVALTRVAEGLAPGGVIYVWLYQSVPSRAYRVKSRLRKLLAPLPDAVKYAAVLPLVPLAAFRDRTLSWREHLIFLVDFFTPKYRWEHTPEEVALWLHQAGLASVCTASRNRDGFGVRARRPPIAPRAAAPSSARDGGVDGENCESRGGLT